MLTYFGVLQTMVTESEQIMLELELTDVERQLLLLKLLRKQKTEKRDDTVCTSTAMLSSGPITVVALCITVTFS